MSDHEDDNEDYEGLRILGPDPDMGDQADNGDDDALPHWADAPEGDSWADDQPQWEEPAAPPAAPEAPGLDTLGGGLGDQDDFNPSLLPPDDYDEWDEGDELAPNEVSIGSPYAEDPDQYGAVPAVALEDEGTEAAPPPSRGPGRDLTTAIAVGVGLAGLALVCFALGKKPTVVLVAVVLGVAALEFFTTLRERGYHPLALPGIAAVAALPIASYWRGPEAVGLILFLTIVVGALWYLLDVSDEPLVPNLSVTMLGVVYIGVLGSFAGLMLAAPNGIGMLLAAIIVTVAYDVGAYFVGSTMGRSSFSAASPNKTVEGLLGGGAAAIVAAIVVLFIVGLTPFGSEPGGFVEALSLGVAAAIFAPLGDLAESAIKRDLEIKDIGSFLPGHGGLLDRFDGLLFVLPVTYYLVRLFDLF